MGRELKRVSLDFRWPIGQVWKGYISPYRSLQCKACDGGGLNPETKKLSDDWYTHLRADGQEGWGYHLDKDDVQALLDNDRLWDFTRVPINEEQAEIVKKKISDGGNSWLPESNGYVPTPEEVNAWARNGFGHDAINQWICVVSRAKRLGIYGVCEYCDGEGEVWYSEEIKELAENFTGYGPPAGRGYQLWSTTTEGHPMSPVFESIDELARWLEKNNASVFGSATATKEEWAEMLKQQELSYKDGNNVFV